MILHFCIIGKDFWDFLGGSGAYEDLIEIYEEVGEEIRPELDKKFKKKGYAYFKKALITLLNLKLGPFRNKKRELEQRELYIKEIIRQGAKRAGSLAASTMEEVRDKVGFLPPY